MSAQACSTHADRVAIYHCDGCDRTLCPDCVQQSHVLFLCRLCGERALPIGGVAPATVKEHAKRQKLSRAYSLPQAFLYPFRGLGLYLFLATLVTMAFVEFVGRFGLGCLAIFVVLGFWSLMVGIQFKIVDATARGDDELPDWPDYLSIGERIPDILAYVGIVLLQFGPLVAYFFLAGPERLFTERPNLAYWIGFAVFGWLGAAIAIVALGAAGRFGPGAAVRIDLHFKAFVASGRDALVIADLVFVLGVIVWLARVTLTAAVPLAGAAVAGTLGAYWIFTSAHLAGLLVRRNSDAFEALYD